MTDGGTAQRIVLSSLVSAALLVTGCAQEKSGSLGLYRDHAPQNSEDVGTVIQIDPSEISQLEIWATENAAQIRSLYPTKGLYEIFGAQDELKVSFGHAVLGKNRYVELQSEKRNLSPLAIVKAELSQLPANDEVGFDLDDCVNDELKPEAKVTALTHRRNLLSSPIFELGKGPYRTSSTRSKPAVAGDTLERMWVVLGPKQSDLTGLRSEDLEFEFNPEIPGEYRVYLFVKDSRNVCDGVGFRVGITSDEAYKRSRSSRSFNSSDARRFHHLELIDAQNAWELSKGSGVTIAIVDTGVNYNHPDLTRNTWINKREIAGNGRDDDGNGFVDDVTGWDFSMNDETPFDDGSHGTHVAGLAASSVFGVAPNAKIMALKALGVFGNGDDAGIAAAILYAVDNGADVINLSLGSTGSGSSVLKAALNYAERHDVLVAAAAGNGDRFGVGFDIDNTPVNPAGLPNENIVSVAATTSGGSLTRYSNFGLENVDIGAPGGSMMDGSLMSASYVPSKGQYIGMSGTSMASPVVAGVLALMRSHNPNASATQIKAMLMNSGVESSRLSGKVSSGKVVNATSALTAVENQML